MVEKMQHKYLKLAKNVAESIKTCRENAGLTQDQVAERLEIGVEAVSRLERGITVPTITRVAELADIFNCTIEDLLGGSSTRTADQVQYIAQLLSTLPTEDREMLVDVVQQVTERLKDRL